jgi:hypothetical protein
MQQGHGQSCFEHAQSVKRQRQRVALGLDAESSEVGVGGWCALTGLAPPTCEAVVPELDVGLVVAAAVVSLPSLVRVLEGLVAVLAHEASPPHDERFSAVGKDVCLKYDSDFTSTFLISAGWCTQQR